MFLATGRGRVGGQQFGSQCPGADPVQILASHVLQTDLLSPKLQVLRYMSYIRYMGYIVTDPRQRP